MKLRICVGLKCPSHSPILMLLPLSLACYFGTLYLQSFSKYQLFSISSSRTCPTFITWSLTMATASTSESGTLASFCVWVLANHVAHLRPPYVPVSTSIIRILWAVSALQWAPKHLFTGLSPSPSDWAFLWSILDFPLSVQWALSPQTAGHSVLKHSTVV